MAGDIKSKFGSQGTLTWTALNSLAGSSSFLAGAGSLAVDNSALLALDILIALKVTWSSTAPAAATTPIRYKQAPMTEILPPPSGPAPTVVSTEPGRLILRTPDTGHPQPPKETL